MFILLPHYVSLVMPKDTADLNTPPHPAEALKNSAVQSMNESRIPQPTQMPPYNLPFQRAKVPVTSDT
jgi:hypothetical protein